VTAADLNGDGTVIAQDLSVDRPHREVHHGPDRGVLRGRRVLVRAVLYDFAVIGEAAKGISVTLRAAHAEVPWSEMAGMRDVVVHQYFGIDASIVWRAATISVPRVMVQLGSLLD